MLSADDPRANANLLICEVGNSHISIAGSVDSQIRVHERFGHDDWTRLLDFAVQSWNALPGDRIKAIAACSVVPEITERLCDHLDDRIDSPVLMVGRELHRPLSLAIEAPESVGIDRVCCAAAAYDQLRAACVIASFGTAITVDCVNDQGAFMGGAILPGLALQSSALHRGTAQLPKVDVASTGKVYGGTTEQAIRNGILYGVAGALREITERYATELNAWPQLVVTGGSAGLVSEHCDFVDHHVPDLCMRGIELAYRRHFMPFEDEADAS